MSVPAPTIHRDWLRPGRRRRHRPAWRAPDIPHWPPDAERLVPDDSIEAIQRDYAAYWQVWAAEQRARHPDKEDDDP